MGLCGSGGATGYHLGDHEMRVVICGSVLGFDVLRVQESVDRECDR